MKLYRYERNNSLDNPHDLILREFEVLDEEKNGFWIEINGKRRFTIKENKCRDKTCKHDKPCREFACITKEGALHQFISRTQRIIIISRATLQVAQGYLKTAKSLNFD